MFEKAPKWAWGLVIGIATVFFVVGIWWIKSEKLPAEARVEIPTYGTYNFSSAIVPGEVEIPFRPDSFSKVTLSAAVVFRTDPSNDIEIIFIDGSRYVDGPRRQVWYGLKRGIFKMRGLKEAGVLKISLERKS